MAYGAFSHYVGIRDRLHSRWESLIENVTGQNRCFFAHVLSQNSKLWKVGGRRGEG